MVEIFYVYSPNCTKCEWASYTLDCAIKRTGIECNLRKFKFDPELDDNHPDNAAAIAICAKNGIEETPGFVIGKSSKHVFVGVSYTEDDIVTAIKAESN